MVAARIPAMTSPASTAGSKLVESRIKTFSDADEVSSSVGYKVRPMTPINTATTREMNTQTVAMRRERVSSFSADRHKPEQHLGHAEIPKPPCH